MSKRKPKECPAEFLTDLNALCAKHNLFLVAGTHGMCVATRKEGRDFQQGNRPIVGTYSAGQEEDCGGVWSIGLK